MFAIDRRNAMLLNNAKIICDGNSITQSVYGLETSYPKQLENLLNSLGYDVSVINLGIWGQTTVHMLNNAIQQVDRLFDPSRLSLVIAMEGGNHIYFGASPQEAYECFADYCAARQAVGFKVIAVDTFPRMTGYWPGFVNVEGYALASMQYNQLVRANWPKFADLYFDARWHLPEFDARPPYMPDGVHPNIDGNARLAAKLATFISNNLRSEPQAIATVVD